jgi:hypothetical protein
MTMPERVPQVEIVVAWSKPHQNTAALNCNSDRAGTRAIDAARAAVRFALESADGEATVTITVRRKAKHPVAVEVY